MRQLARHASLAHLRQRILFNQPLLFKKTVELPHGDDRARDRARRELSSSQRGDIQSKIDSACRPPVADAARGQKDRKAVEITAVSLDGILREPFLYGQRLQEGINLLVERLVHSPPQERARVRSEEHTSELQSPYVISY